MGTYFEHGWRWALNFTIDSRYKVCDPKLLKPSDFDYQRAQQSNIDTKTLGKTLYALAQAYLEGLGTTKDEQQGLEYLKKAVEFENKEAVLALEKWQKPH
ncbi:SEL1-like repeat protein [Helicobacter salomonis]|uniref:SEL1-like repeat protein n=1 Tax=Helicobacter salomonis TaxID=56878 RepID=UPI0013156F30|nr:SEL1-like repeat protein [Helicobacter salomonis]